MEGCGTAVLLPIGIGVFLMGMNKGGFPVGSIALPVFILFWPQEAQQAKGAVAFMLPLLCAMDVVALVFYWRHVMWRRILFLVPGSLAGVAVASILFVSKDDALISVPDRRLKLIIGALGVLFVACRLGRPWITKAVTGTFRPGWQSGGGFGFAAGVTSTIAHAAGPVMQMYLLPQKLDKMNFAATNAGYFWFINLVKVLPFALLGRFDGEMLTLDALMLPIIPFGVGLGYLVVRKLEQRHYIGFIYFVLLVTSVILIIKALTG